MSTTMSSSEPSSTTLPPSEIGNHDGPIDTTSSAMVSEFGSTEKVDANFIPAASPQSVTSPTTGTLGSFRFGSFPSQLQTLGNTSSGFLSSMQGKIQAGIQTAKQTVDAGFTPPTKGTRSTELDANSNKVGALQAEGGDENLVAATTASTSSAALNLHSLQTSTEQLASKTKGWGLSAFKTLSTTAQKVSASMTESLQREQDEFIRQKRADPEQNSILATPDILGGGTFGVSRSAVGMPVRTGADSDADPTSSSGSIRRGRGSTELLPVWSTIPLLDESLRLEIKNRILSLSKDARNFLLPPPPGTDFIFDFNIHAMTALATLKQDLNLEKMRFELVPREIEEKLFWRNYFYRCTLLKQAAMAAQATGATLDQYFQSTAATTTAEKRLSTGPEDLSSTTAASTISSAAATSSAAYNLYFGTSASDGAALAKRSGSSGASNNNGKKSKNPSTLAAPKEEVLFEAEMPDHEEDPDAWLEKQLASDLKLNDSEGDEEGSGEVADWEKELQNELKDYVE